MPVRLLLFSDLHLDTPFAWADPAAARARRHGLRDTLSRVVDLAVTLEVDALCCAGDLYEHERFAPDTGQFLQSEFARADRPVFLAPGNHDWFGPASLYAQVPWTDNVHVFPEDHLTPVELAPGVTLWGAAHRAPANTDGFLDHFHTDREGVNLALFHGSEVHALSFQEEGKSPHAPFRAEQIPRAGLAHAMVGHFHTPVDAAHHTYPGNPDPLTFGETGPRAAVLLEVGDDGTVQRSRHPVASTHMSDVTVDVTGAKHSGQVRDRAVEALSGVAGMARLTITGELDPAMDVRPDDLTAQLRAACPGLSGLLVRTKDLRAGYDLAAIAEERTVRGQFVTDVLADLSLDDQTRRKVILTGLRALDGRAAELEVS